MSSSRFFRVAGLIAMVSASIVTGSLAGLAAERVKLLIPARIVNEAFSPFTVAKYLGYFDAEGLDVTLLAVGGSNEVAIAVNAGAAEVGAASPGQALVGLQTPQTLDLRYFYEANYRSIWTITVAPDSPVKTIADLKGKKLGMAAMGSAAATFGRALVREAGLDPDRDVSFLSVGSGAQAMSALNSNAVDGLVFSSQETSKFEANGFKIRYLDTGEGFASLPDVGLLTRPETLASKPTVLIGIARAVAKGYVFSLNNAEAAVRITWKVYPETEPKNVSSEEALKGGMKVNQSRMEIWDSPRTKGQLGLFIDEDWRRMIVYMRNNGLLREDIPLDRIFTNALVPEINRFDREAVRKQAQAFDLKTLK